MNYQLPESKKYKLIELLNFQLERLTTRNLLLFNHQLSHNLIILAYSRIITIKITMQAVLKNEIILNE